VGISSLASSFHGISLDPTQVEGNLIAPSLQPQPHPLWSTLTERDRASFSLPAALRSPSEDCTGNQFP